MIAVSTGILKNTQILLPTNLGTFWFAPMNKNTAFFLHVIIEFVISGYHNPIFMFIADILFERNYKKVLLNKIESFFLFV